jgi:predicted ester cyclase
LGTEGFKEARRRFFQEFPGSRTTIDHIVLAEDDQVFAMLTTTATNKQTGKQTNKQTGKRVTIKSADLYRIEDGKIAEY